MIFRIIRKNVPLDCMQNNYLAQPLQDQGTSTGERKKIRI